MSIKIRPMADSDLAAVVALFKTLGMSISEESYRRFFIGKIPSGGEGVPRGGLEVVDQEAGCVGFEGMTACAIYLNGKPMSACILGALGIRPGFGGTMFDLMDHVGEIAKSRLTFANTCNSKASQLMVQYAGFSRGPVRNAFIQFAVLPIGFFLQKGMDSVNEFEQIKSSDFWMRYLESCRGVVLDRTPERIERLFGAAIREKRAAVVIVKEKGQIVGYAVLHAVEVPKLHARRFKIVDLIALRNDRRVLRRLVAKCKWYAAAHGGIVLEYVGACDVFRWKRKALSNTFIWSCGDDLVAKALEDETTWFFGPYDGDRSMI